MCKIVHQQYKCRSATLGEMIQANWTGGCRARGIDADAARQVLVYSFGAEVTQHLKHKQLIQRVQKVVASTLAKAPLLVEQK